MSNSNYEKIYYYNNMIISARYTYEDNMRKIEYCRNALARLKKARNGINFMIDQQIPYTSSSSKKAFHFNEEYYNVLKLRDDSYMELIASIMREIDSEIYEIINENKKITNNINIWNAEIVRLNK